MNVTQPTLSHHMKVLCDSGIVISRKEGKWMHYSISPAGVETAKKYLDTLIVNTKENDNKPCCGK